MREAHHAVVLRPGIATPTATVTTVAGDALTLPLAGTWTLLSFLRYASCPACNLRVRELRNGADALHRAGIQWYAIFHSPDRRLKQHMPDAVWGNIIADPAGELGAQFATRRSWGGIGLSLVLPAFYRAFVRTLAYGYWGGAVDGWFHTMPADFLVAPDGRIRLAHYGRHIVDHLDVAAVVAAAVRTEAARR
jgi:peroxiredoxin